MLIPVMIRELKLHWKLQKLFSEQEALHKKYDLLIITARKDKSSQNELASIYSEAGFESGLLTDSIDSMVTRFWIREAQRKFVPIPDRKEGEFWKQSEIDEEWQLTSKGISAIRAAVRDEVKHSREIWAILGAVITGAIGAATGLIAILKQ